MDKPNGSPVTPDSPKSDKILEFGDKIYLNATKLQRFIRPVLKFSSTKDGSVFESKEIVFHNCAEDDLYASSHYVSKPYTNGSDWFRGYLCLDANYKSETVNLYRNI